MKSAPLFVAVVLTLSFYCAPAHAQATPAEFQAKQLFEQGVKLFNDRKREEARVLFLDAYRLAPKPEILWNLALSEFHSGHELDALFHLRDYVKLPNAKPEHVKEARDGLIAQAERKAEERNMGRIVFVGAPAGVALRVDGRALDQPALEKGSVDVIAGVHRFEVTGGGRHVNNQYTVAAAERIIINLDSPAPTVSEPIESTAGARVEKAPATPEATKSDGSATKTVVVVALGAVAVASVTTGVIFGVGSKNDQNRADDYSAKYGPSGCAQAAPYCADWHDAVDGAKSKATLGNVFLYTGVGLAVGAVATWFLWPSKQDVARAWIAPSIAPGAAGVNGAFRF